MLTVKKIITQQEYLVILEAFHVSLSFELVLKARQLVMHIYTDLCSHIELRLYYLKIRSICYGYTDECLECENHTGISDLLL